MCKLCISSFKFHSKFYLLCEEKNMLTLFFIDNV